MALALGNVFLFYSYKSPKTIKPQICIRSPFYFTEQVPLLPNLWVVEIFIFALLCLVKSS